MGSVQSATYTSIYVQGDTVLVSPCFFLGLLVLTFRNRSAIVGPTVNTRITVVGVSLSKEKAMKLDTMGLFATPESADTLMKYIEQFSGAEKVLALTVMGMTWNLCAKLTNDEQEKASW